MALAGGPQSKPDDAKEYKSAYSPRGRASRYPIRAEAGPGRTLVLSFTLGGTLKSDKIKARLGLLAIRRVQMLINRILREKQADRLPTNGSTEI